MSLTENTPAPDFTLQRDGGETIALADFAGRYLVIFFYPKDDTPGCTKESCGFRDSFAEFAALDCQIIGVSPDDVASHERFIDKFSLNFPLLADFEGAMCRAYGVMRDGEPYIERATFLLDESRVIRRIWRNVNVDGHVDEVLVGVKAL